MDKFTKLFETLLEDYTSSGIFGGNVTDMGMANADTYATGKSYLPYQFGKVQKRQSIKKKNKKKSRKYKK